MGPGSQERTTNFHIHEIVISVIAGDIDRYKYGKFHVKPTEVKKMTEHGDNVKKPHKGKDKDVK